MIRANIVTVYNSKNHGSFLQAFALGDALLDMTGYAPRYVETGARLPGRGLVADAKRAIKNVGARFGVKKWSLEAEHSTNHELALLNFDVISMDCPFGDSDLLVFGSDEIWNLGRKNIADFPAFWGSGITGGERVAYAPATNGADLMTSACADDFKRGLDEFALLSVRDPVSERSVRKLTGRNVEVVCDPALLLTVDTYRELQCDTELENYLLVYSYGNKMTEADIAAIRGFARSHELKIVSGGFYLPWCDACVPAGPFEFLGLMDKAEYVVTDTFHGTVFSSIYHKRYASFGRSNTKVIEFMGSYGLNDRMAGDGRSVEECLTAEAEFTAFDTAWADMREKSRDFLQKAVDLCVDKSGEGVPTDQIEVRRGVPLAPLTSFKMGGKAARLWVPKRGDDLRALPKGKNGYLVLSAGSNLLVSERTFTDIVSMREFDDSIEELGDGEYRVGASVRIQRLISKVNADGYGGIEALVSIPAMVGGLICMNASVPSAQTCISDYLVSVEIFDGGKVIEVSKTDCGLGYRTSAFQDGHALILGARFRFPEQDPTVSSAKVDARRKYVKESQDKSAPNFGSVFRDSSGRAMNLIRKWGLAVGGISFSRKTGNWILNGGGSFDDAMSLLGKAVAVNRLFGKKAKLEVRVWR